MGNPELLEHILRRYPHLTREEVCELAEYHGFDLETPFTVAAQNEDARD